MFASWGRSNFGDRNLNVFGSYNSVSSTPSLPFMFLPSRFRSFFFVSSPPFLFPILHFRSDSLNRLRNSSSSAGGNVIPAQRPQSKNMFITLLVLSCSVYLFAVLHFCCAQFAFITHHEGRQDSSNMNVSHLVWGKYFAIGVSELINCNPEGASILCLSCVFYQVSICEPPPWRLHSRISGSMPPYMSLLINANQC